jgi:DNA-binding transcriptional ArsR family regulator
MKRALVLRDPDAFQLLSDETRRKIVYLLRVKEMTVSQLAAELGVTPQAVYHHMRKLLKGKLIEVAREERVEHLIESYYRATAEIFILSHGKADRQVSGDKKLAKETITTILNVLKKIGLNIQADEDKISQLADLQMEVEQCCSGAEKLEEEIYGLDDLDFGTAMKAADLAGTITMSDEEFAHQQEARKKLKTLLDSMTAKQ